MTATALLLRAVALIAALSPAARAVEPDGLSNCQAAAGNGIDPQRASCHIWTQAAVDIERGKGCAVKLLMDSWSHLEDRLSAFRRLASQHRLDFPSSRAIVQLGVPYRGSTVTMTVTSMETWTPTLTVPLIGRVNIGTVSEWRVIFKDEFDPEDGTRKSDCVDISDGPRPHRDAGE